MIPIDSLLTMFNLGELLDLPKKVSSATSEGVEKVGTRMPLQEDWGPPLDPLAVCRAKHDPSPQVVYFNNSVCVLCLMCPHFTLKLLCDSFFVIPNVFHMFRLSCGAPLAQSNFRQMRLVCWLQASERVKTGTPTPDRYPNTHPNTGPVSEPDAFRKNPSWDTNTIVTIYRETRLILISSIQELFLDTSRIFASQCNSFSGRCASSGEGAEAKPKLKTLET